MLYVFFFLQTISFAQGNSLIVSIEDPGGLESSIGDNWSEIDSIIIHGSINETDLKTLSQYCLYGELAKIDLSDAHIEEMRIPAFCFKGCSKLETILFPTDVQSIEKGAFQGCINFCADLPDNIKYIGPGAFDHCNFQDLVLPASIETISGCSFNENENITSIHCLSAIPPTVIPFGTNYDQSILGDSYSTPTDLPIYVPNGASESYRNTHGWHYFQNYNELDVTSSTIVIQPEDMSTYQLSGRRITEKVNSETFLIIRQGKKSKKVAIR